MKRLSIISIFLPIFVSSCTWDPGGFKAQERWLAQKKEERVAYERKVDEDKRNRIKKEKEDNAEFESSHPEVEVGKIDVGALSTNEKKLAVAINRLGFVTRYPENQTIDNVYVKVGGYNLTIRRFQIAIEKYSDDCKRISAYNNSDYKKECVSSLVSGIDNFSTVLNDKKIPDKTKMAALREASFSNYIDFEHAARLARMHFKLCKQKGDVGYVDMVTVSVPCSG